MSEHTAESEIRSPEWESPEGTKKVADFVRGRKGMTVRHGVELGKRVEYFKGDKLVSFLLQNSEAAKHCPTVKTKSEALQIGQLLMRQGYIHGSERDSKNKKMLTPLKDNSFRGDGYYTWMYDGPKTLRNFLTGILIAGFLCCTCFPIWPMWAKVGLWYISVTFLIIIFVFSILRLVAFFLCWLAGYDFWFLPNVFDDNLGVIESFQPLYSFKVTGSGERYYRGGAAVAFVAFCIWVANQPTEFDEYVSLTKQFTEDIYSGKMLDEMSQHQRDGIDKLKVPALEELMRDEDHDIFSEPNEEEIFDKYMEEKYFSKDAQDEDNDDANIED